LYCVECWEKAQPQGKWVDLTKAEIWDIREPGYLSFADALIAKFKEKNTPKIVPQGEPVELPCCGYTKPEAIKWNQFNGVVQCHNCGQVYNITPPSVEAAIEATKEKAAKVCESLFDINIHDWDVIEGASMCASAIRSMK
jgi:transcription elongation factor Elf1